MTRQTNLCRASASSNGRTHSARTRSQRRSRSSMRHGMRSPNTENQERTKIMKYDGTNLAAVLAAHKAWYYSEANGERADLRGANLRDADLRDANLRGADLRGADLRDAD